MARRNEEKQKRMKIRIKKDDQVKVIAGRDKDKTGRVIEVDQWMAVDVLVQNREIGAKA